MVYVNEIPSIPSASVVRVSIHISIIDLLCCVIQPSLGIREIGSRSPSGWQNLGILTFLTFSGELQWIQLAFCICGFFPSVDTEGWLLFSIRSVADLTAPLEPGSFNASLLPQPRAEPDTAGINTCLLKDLLLSRETFQAQFTFHETPWQRSDTSGGLTEVIPY